MLTEVAGTAGTGKRGVRQGCSPPPPTAGVKGSPSPAGPPRPHPAGGSPGSGFPSQAGPGHGSMHLKFLLALKLGRAAGGGGQRLRGEHPPAPRAGSTHGQAGAGVWGCVCAHACVCALRGVCVHI